MAKAQVTTKVILELSLIEARTLVTILQEVGGHPFKSPRGWANQIGNALHNERITSFRLNPTDSFGAIMLPNYTEGRYTDDISSSI